MSACESMEELELFVEGLHTKTSAAAYGLHPSVTVLRERMDPAFGCFFGHLQTALGCAHDSRRAAEAEIFSSAKQVALTTLQKLPMLDLPRKFAADDISISADGT